MAQQLEELPLKVHYGHTDSHIFMQFTRATSNLLLAPEHVDAMVTELQRAKAMFLEAQTKKAKNG